MENVNYYHQLSQDAQKTQSVLQKRLASLVSAGIHANVVPMLIVKLLSTIQCVHASGAMKVIQKFGVLKLDAMEMTTVRLHMHVGMGSVHQCVDPTMSLVAVQLSVRELNTRLFATARLALKATHVHSVLPLAVSPMMPAQMTAAASTNGVKVPAVLNHAKNQPPAIPRTILGSVPAHLALTAPSTMAARCW